MKTIIKCRVAGCTHEPFSSPQGESMHYNRVHSRIILVPKQKSRMAANGHKAPIELTPARQEVPAEKLELKNKVRQKRRYQKKGITSLPVQVDLLFCPRCLCDLHSVGVGMVLAKANSTVNGCPNCGLDLRVVAMGMAMRKTAKA